MKLSLIKYVFLIFLTGACGYKHSDVSFFKEGQKIDVPYIEGDLDGRLTSSVITALASSSGFRYSPYDPDLILKIEILKNQDLTIGYQYDIRQSNDELINRLVPNEGRRAVLVKVQLLDRINKKRLIEPFQLEADADFDFVNFDNYKDLTFVNSEGKTLSVLQYSLGQLDAKEGAKEAALKEAYQKLARKIVVFLQNL